MHLKICLTKFNNNFTMRQITFDGRLGKDAVVGTAKNGTQYLKFSVANNTFANGEEKTEWFDVTTFNDFIIKPFQN